MINSIIKSADELTGAVSDFEAGRCEEAARECTRLIESGQEVIPALLLRSKCYIAAGRVDDAVYDNGRAAVMLPLTGSELVLFAESSLETGMPGEYCAEMMTRAGEKIIEQERDPSKETLIEAANAYNRAGICRFHSGASVDSELDSYVTARKLMVRAKRKGEFDKSGRQLYALIISNLSECYSRKGCYTQARELCEQAADELRQYVREDDLCRMHYCLCLNGLADIDCAEERNVSARARLTQIIEIYAEAQKSPDCRLDDQQTAFLSTTYNKRGTLRYQMGDYEGEIEDCTKAITLRSTLPKDNFSMSTLYLNCAEAYEQLGLFQKAAEAYYSSAAMMRETDIDAAQTIAAVRVMMSGNCFEEDDSIDMAFKCYAEAADSFSLVTDRIRAAQNGEPVEELPVFSDENGLEYSPEQIIEMEALCRLRLGMGLCRRKCHDYYGGLNQNLAALDLLGLLPDTPDTASKISVVAHSIGEIYELFDDYDTAAEYFGMAEDMMARLSEEQENELLELLEQSLGEAFETDEAETQPDGDDDTLFFSETVFGGSDHEDYESESLTDDGKYPAHDDEEVSGEDEVWEESSDDTPQG